MKFHAAEELETRALASTPVFAALSVLLQTPAFAESKHATEMKSRRVYHHTQSVRRQRYNTEIIYTLSIPLCMS